jgi:hypothetical protein
MIVVDAEVLEEEVGEMIVDRDIRKNCHPERSLKNPDTNRDFLNAVEGSFILADYFLSTLFFEYWRKA